MSCLKNTPDEGDESVKKLRRALMDAINQKGDSSSIFLHDSSTYELLVMTVSLRTGVGGGHLNGLPFHALRRAFEKTNEPIDPDIPENRLSNRDYISPAVFGILTSGLLYFNSYIPAIITTMMTCVGAYNIYSVHQLNRATERRNNRIGHELAAEYRKNKAAECASGICRYCDP